MAVITLLVVLFACFAVTYAQIGNTTGLEDLSKGDTVVSTAGDAMFMADVKKAGWNAMKCHDKLSPPGAGGCTPVACAEGGIPAKWQTAKLQMHTIGTEIYVKGNPTTVKKASAQTCCNTCAATPGCAYWQYIPDITLGGKKTPGACFMTKTDIKTDCGSMTIQYDVSSKPLALQVRSGGHCNDNAKVLNDPHMVGAHGTRFDFNGVPDRAFCLVTDHNVQVNMKLRGYYDERTEGAALIVGGKAVRTWIKEMGIIWHAEGVDHQLHLVARDGKQQERGSGFMKAIEVDGKVLPRMTVGQVVKAAGGLTIRFIALEKEGQFDVDYYTVSIAGIIAIDIRMRIAHPLLQTPSDAETHMNVAVTDLNFSEEVHGVLGQTYREDHVQRAMDFQRVIATLHHPISADGDSGKGFLDGTPRSYEASSVLAVDCSHTVYSRAKQLSPFSH